jgi:WD40 repeat protein
VVCFVCSLDGFWSHIFLTVSTFSLSTGDFSVKVWDAITGTPLHSFQHKHVVKTVDWSPNSRRLATGGNEGVLRVFDIMHPDQEPLQFVQNKEEVCCFTLYVIDLLLHLL